MGNDSPAGEAGSPALISLIAASFWCFGDAIGFRQVPKPPVHAGGA